MSTDVDSEALEVLVFGSAIIDFICYTPRLPAAGETLHGHKFERGYGGKGANQCVAASRLGSRCALIAKLGDDSFGHDYIRQLAVEQVQLQHVELLPGATTGIAQIAVADGGENNIIIVAGANDSLSSDDVKRAKQLFDQAKVLVCQLETPVAATLAALQSFQGVSIVNAAPALAQLPRELLQLASILCVNETEAALMTNVDNISSISEANEALKRLVELGANTVIITLGRQGAVCAENKADQLHLQHVAAPYVEPKLVVDTTGAGDAFIGALAHQLARYPQRALVEQIAAACAVASQSVQLRGTQASFPRA